MRGDSLRIQPHLFHSFHSPPHGQQSYRNYTNPFHCDDKNSTNHQRPMTNSTKKTGWIIQSMSSHCVTSTPSTPSHSFLPNENYVIESSIKLSCLQLVIAQFCNSWELLIGEPSVLSSNWSLKRAPSHYMLSLWTLRSVESPYQQWPGLDLTQRLVSIRKAECRRPGRRQQAAGGELQRCCSVLPLNYGFVFTWCLLESILM